jgi:hypothetical protein
MVEQTPPNFSSLICPRIFDFNSYTFVPFFTLSLQHNQPLRHYNTLATMEDEAEILPKNTIPALLPLPGAAPLTRNTRAGDGQNWPLTNAGTGVITATTPQPWQHIFWVMMRGS